MAAGGLQAHLATPCLSRLPAAALAGRQELAAAVLSVEVGGGGGGGSAADFLGGAMQGLGLDGSEFPRSTANARRWTSVPWVWAPGFSTRFCRWRLWTPATGRCPASRRKSGTAGLGLLPWRASSVPRGGGGMQGLVLAGASKGGAINTGISAAVNLGGALFSDLFNPGPGHRTRNLPVAARSLTTTATLAPS